MWSDLTTKTKMCVFFLKENLTLFGDQILTHYSLFRLISFNFSSFNNLLGCMYSTMILEFSNDGW